MFHLLFTALSYGAMLVLLLPTTLEAIVSNAVLFILSCGLLIYKNAYKKGILKNKHLPLIPISIFISANLGIHFYNRWLPSSKMHLVASVLHMQIQTLLLIASLILSVFSVYIVYVGLHTIIYKLFVAKPQKDYERTLIYCLITAASTVMMTQLMIDISILSMGFLNFLFGSLIVATVILLFYCIIGRVMPAFTIGSGIFMVISTVNVYVYRFRGRLLEPVDIFSAGTAMNVLENYSLFPIPPKVLIGWIVFAIMLLFIYFMQRKEIQNLTLKTRLAILATCVISFGSIFLYANNLKTYHWNKEGASFNGYILDFVSKFKEIAATKPENYTHAMISDMAKLYDTENNRHPSSTSSSPHIIVIMNEAFSDLSVLGDFSTNMEVMPFISSLKEDTISGSTLVSVYGGNTANSEYEFLTGNSLAFLSPNVVPYQQYVRSSTYSMVSHLKTAYSYKCLAMHPSDSNNWNRPTAYKNLGFDEWFFLEDFPQKDFVRWYVSDKEMFESLIKLYEARKNDPLFIWSVTMQNHGNYTYIGENYTQSISLMDYPGKFPEVEQYLSLIHETDKAVEYLISYFENVDDDVIIVFYGDHQPKIVESFYETISGTAANTLDEQQKRYEIPFFIWANYDIAEQYIERTSLNYLSSYVYDAAGIPLPPYNQFLRDMEAVIPAVNANGFYSLANGRYLTIEEATGEEQQWLQTYEALQYNNIFDKANQNQVLFPVLE